VQLCICGNGLSWLFMVVYFMHMVVVVQCGKCVSVCGVVKAVRIKRNRCEQSGILRVSAVMGLRHCHYGIVLSVVVSSVR